jgi:hypothetical protein
MFLRPLKISAASLLFAINASLSPQNIAAATGEAAMPPSPASPTSPAALALSRVRDSLAPRMANSPFKIPLIIESRQSAGVIKGDVYAEVKHPFATVSAALGSPQVWCDILILHLNTKSCALQAAASNAPESPTLIMSVGKKLEQQTSASFPIALLWKASQRKADFLQVNLSADSGPLSTKNYRILLEAIPIENGNTFIHFSYEYGFGTTAKLLMKAYLSTIGRNKVGFTITGKRDNGDPIYIEGLLGLVERNTMRYHLAVEAYLGALRVPPTMQFEKRIGDWFAAAERYPQQLHEVELREYLDVKRIQYRRQQLLL